MPKDRVCATDTVLPAVSRRSLMAAPLLLLPRNTFARNAAPVGEDSEIIRLFHEYNRLSALHETADNEIVEDRIFEQMLAVEQKMIGLPSTSAADFAAKVMVHTGEGIMCFGDVETDKVLIEARRLLGRGY